MKTFQKLSGILFLTAMCLGVGCSAAMNKAIVTTMVEASLATCLAENPIEGEPSAEEMKQLQTACKFADNLWPFVKQFLLAQKQGAAKLESKKAPKLTLDAGSHAEAGVDAGK